jgi:hypothetical protein
VDLGVVFGGRRTALGGDGECVAIGWYWALVPRGAEIMKEKL